MSKRSKSSALLFINSLILAMLREVRITTGIFAKLVYSRKLLNNSKPFIRGISKSDTITLISGCNCNFYRASTPF